MMTATHLTPCSGEKEEEKEEEAGRSRKLSSEFKV